MKGQLKTILKIIPKTMKGRAIAGGSIAVASAIPIHNEYQKYEIRDKKLNRRWKGIEKLLESQGVYAGTGHKRVAIPKEKLTEDSIKQLGFQKSLISVPESGQDMIYSYRHPDFNHHIHSHPGLWTIHKDRFSSSQMIAKRARTVGGKVLSYIKGMPHVISEGAPGVAYYIKGTIKRNASTASNVMSEQSMRMKKNVKRWANDKSSNLIEKKANMQYLEKIAEEAFIDELEKIAQGVYRQMSPQQKLNAGKNSVPKTVGMSAPLGAIGGAIASKVLKFNPKIGAAVGAIGFTGLNVNRVLNRRKNLNNQMQKIAKGKYPIVEDEFGKTMVTGGSVAGGGYVGYKAADKIKKMLGKRGGKYGKIGAGIGAIGGALLYNKTKGKK